MTRCDEITAPLLLRVVRPVHVAVRDLGRERVWAGVVWWRGVGAVGRLDGGVGEVNGVGQTRWTNVPNLTESREPPS